MKRSETKSKRKRKDNKEVNVDSVVNNILAKKLTISEAVDMYDVSRSSLTKKLASMRNTNNPPRVFTHEQECTLREHIIKCCKTQYGVTNTVIRKMAYEYASKLPDCKYPKRWDTDKMASVDWFINFKSRHSALKKALVKKYQHTCICIMGCHMGPEGEQALKKLEAKVLIARVYHYLQREYDYMKMCNDLGLLVNILRRTAEATGVCEQTITKILDEEKRTASELNDIVPTPPKQKKKEDTIMKEHSYSNDGENSNVETVDEDSSSSNNVQYTDFERLQQDASLIKSVEVEILDEEFEEQEDQHNSGTESRTTESTKHEPSENGDRDDETKVSEDSLDVKHSELDEKNHAKDKKMRIIFTDSESEKLDDKLRTEDKIRLSFTDSEPDKAKLDDNLPAEDKMRISFTDSDTDKPTSTEVPDTANSSSDDLEVELVIDESYFVPTQGSTIDVPVAIPKSNAQKWREYLERMKVNIQKEGNSPKSRAQKKAYKKHRAQYMRRYRQQQKIEKLRHQLHRINQNHNDIYSGRVFDPQRKTYKPKVNDKNRAKDEMRINVTDGEVDKLDEKLRTEDRMRISLSDGEPVKPNSTEVPDTANSSFDDFEGELVIDESQINMDHSNEDVMDESSRTEDMSYRIDGEVIPIELNQRKPEDRHTMPLDKLQQSMQI